MRISFVALLLFLFQTILPQGITDLPQYHFIHYQANRFELVHDNPSYKVLYAKFDSLLQYGDNRIKIVHIGGSHIQADVYTHRIRQDLQSLYPGILGSRGFFFPFKIARTNSPSNLSITFTGEWLSGKNTLPDTLFNLGVSGITSALQSKTGSLKIIARYDSVHLYDFNRVRIFCNVTSPENIPCSLPRQHIRNTSVNLKGNFVQYDLSDYTDTLNILVSQQDSLHPFELYGISLENDDPGVVYNAIGVNGAMLKSYLRCGLFNDQLTALDPDWVIISIGTNEGNTRQFDEPAYRNEYFRLIDSIKNAVPKAAILLTVPNDSYLNKKYINHNTARMREIIFDIARSQGCGVWDFYSIMGGLNSAKSWYDNGLMAKDHIHFNKPGYLLKGDLFFTAFLQSWNDPSFTFPAQYPVITPRVSGTPLTDDPLSGTADKASENPVSSDLTESGSEYPESSHP